jgi:hypothetical protein
LIFEDDLAPAAWLGNALAVPEPAAVVVASMPQAA